MLGGVTGAVAGSRYDHARRWLRLTPLSAILIGVLAAAVCHLWRCGRRSSSSSMTHSTCIAVHFIGGVVGSLPGGPVQRQGSELDRRRPVCSTAAGFTLLGWQTVALVSVVAYSFCVTWLIAGGDPEVDGPASGVGRRGVSRHRPARYGGVPLQSRMGLGRGTRGHAGGAERHRASRSTPEPGWLNWHWSPPSSISDSTRVAELEHGLYRGRCVHDRRRARLMCTWRTSTKTTVRNEARSTDIVERLRIEVLVPRDRLEDVEAAFEHFSTGQRPGFTQPVEARS